MKYFNLEPSTAKGGGWSNFNRNAELADFIYKVCLPRVNEGGWSYINPMSNVGIFEDNEGNYLCLSTEDKDEKNFIHEMHIGHNEDKVSGIIQFIERIEKGFGLVRSERKI